MPRREPIRNLHTTMRALAVREGGGIEFLGCHYCCAPLHYPWEEPAAYMTLAVIDHKIPVVRGGRNNLENLVLACSDCNGAKHTRPYLDYLFEWAVYWREVEDEEVVRLAAETARLEERRSPVQI